MISFSARTDTGIIGLLLTLKNVTGRFQIGIRAIGGPHISPTNWYMWESEWVVVE